MFMLYLLPSFLACPHLSRPSLRSPRERLPPAPYAHRNLYNTALIVRLVLTWFPNPPEFLVTPLSCVPGRGAGGALGQRGGRATAERKRVEGSRVMLDVFCWGLLPATPTCHPQPCLTPALPNRPCTPPQHCV